MDTETGKLVDAETANAANAKTTRHRYVEVRRDLTAVEKAEKQIRMYSPCGCGSGKKFRFCCYERGTKR